MSPRRLFQSGLLAALVALSVGALMLAPSAALAASSPTITAVTPATGSSLGGTSISITGTDFQAGASVYIGGILAASARLSATEITATTPAAAFTTGGAANVTIVNPDGGAVSLSSGYFYTAYQPPLTITAVEASTGPNSGGTNVTITGTNFSSSVIVYFGDVPSSVVNPLGSSAIFARTPPNVTGPVSVTVVNPDGLRASRANGFTYIGGIGVTTVAPNAGPLAGGTTITVNGNGFARGATLKIGDTAATGVLVVNSTQIVAVTPPGILGTARLVVTNPDGQSGAKEQGFTYGPAAGATPPVLTSVAPSAGPTSGGTQVTLTGTNFSGGATVFFGGVISPLVNLNGASSMFARTPSGVPGPVTVTVVNNDGSVATLPNAFTFEGPTSGLVVAGVAPETGAAGSIVTVNGVGFNAGSWLTFDGMPAVSSTVIGSTQIVGTVPAGLSGKVSVAVAQVGAPTSASKGSFTVTGTSTPPVTTPPVTTPPVTTPPVVAPPATGGAGTFVAAPTFSASGQALVIFSGGTADQLEAAASGAKATGAWVQDSGGAYRLLVVGGPSFLKDQFKAQFPTGLGVNTAATLTR